MERFTFGDRVTAPWLRLLPETHRALFLACTCLAAAEAVSIAASMDATVPNSLRVFGSLWTSGWAATHGLDPYASYAHTWVFRRSGVEVVDLNLNPPLLLPLFQLFARFDIVFGARILAAATTAVFVVTAARLLRSAPAGVTRLQVLWFFVAPAFQDTLALGQIYGLLFGLSGIAWLCLMRGRTTAAGLAIGCLVALKPTLVIWPLYLALAGHRRLAAVAAATASGLTLLSVAVYGPGVAGEWLAALAADHHGVIPTDASLHGYWLRLDEPRLGLGMAALLVAGCGTLMWRRRADALDASGVAIAVAILAAPLSWFHYTLLLVPALLARPWGRTLQAATLLLCVPVSLPLLALLHPGWGSATFGGIYTAGVVLILVEFLRRPSLAATSRPGPTQETMLGCPTRTGSTAARAA